MRISNVLHTLISLLYIKMTYDKRRTLENMGKIIDITGQRFGKLTAIRKEKKNKHGTYFWLCKCDCGNEKVATIGNLRSGQVKSCGCILAEDLTGKRFERLVPIKQVGRSASRGVIWECKCDCGNIVTVKAQSLKSGETKSCGCFNRDKSTKHGLCNTRLYRIWHGIKCRCYEEKNKKYYLYGAKGIKMCEEWKNDFKKFYEWSISNGYNEKLTIDRIDSEGDYEASNCRWANIYTQNNNRKINHYLEYNGEKHTIAEWARIYKVNRDFFYNRMRKNKKHYTVEEIFEQLEEKRRDNGNCTKY